MKLKTNKVWTYKDFLEGKLKEWEEIVDGKRVKKMPAYKRHGSLNAEIVSNLSDIKRNYKILSGEVAIKIDEKTIRATDIAIVRKDIYENNFGALDCEIELVIEIEEGQLKRRYINKKIDDYLKFGIKRQIWIFLDKEEVWDIDNLGDKKVLSFDDEIDIFGVKIKLRNLI
ncbi:MAG: Uma2 family endonuclease [candidate division WOR-3 bacterium]